MQTFVDESNKLYIGRAFTLEEFKAWWKVQRLGSLPFNAVGLHHTAIPDRNTFQGLQHIHNIFAYYRNELGWPSGRGPHLWLCDGRGSHPSSPKKPTIYVGTHPAHDGIGISGRNHRWLHIEKLDRYDYYDMTDEMYALESAVLQIVCGSRIPIKQVSKSWDGPSSPLGCCFHRLAGTDVKTCPGSRLQPTPYFARINNAPKIAPVKPHPGMYDVGRFNLLASSGEDRGIANSLAVAMEEAGAKSVTTVSDKNKIQYASMRSYDSPSGSSKIYAIVVGRGAVENLDKRARDAKLLDKSMSETGHWNCVGTSLEDTKKKGLEVLETHGVLRGLDENEISEMKESYRAKVGLPLSKDDKNGDPLPLHTHWGMVGATVYSRFNDYRPNAPAQIYHKGEDVGPGPGSLGDDVHALSDGVVYRVRDFGTVSGYNQEVVIKYDVRGISKYVDELWVLYGHIKRGVSAKVKVGQRVKRGQIICECGTDADAMNTKRHIHVEMWVKEGDVISYNNNGAVDPEPIRKVLEDGLRETYGKSERETKKRGVDVIRGLERVTIQQALAVAENRGANMVRARSMFLAMSNVQNKETTWATDVRWARSLLETNNFNYGGDSVWPNPSGIKKDDKEKGSRVGDEPIDFLIPRSVEEAAHIDANHCRAYSFIPGVAPLHGRFDDALAAQKARGWPVKKISQLGSGVWAADPEYSGKIMNILTAMERA